MVDGCFMVDEPCVNHAEKAVNHVLWLTGFLGRWLTEPCLMSNFEFWPSIWYHIEIFHTNFSMRVYLA